MLNAANFELIEINNIFKCLWGLDKLKLHMLRGRGYLKNIQKHTRERGPKTT